MTATQNKWNDYLETIQVEGNNETQKQIFYTALYHTAIHPSLFPMRTDAIVGSTK